MISDAKFKKYVVDVFSDQGALEAGPWTRIGEFARLPDAIEACKQVIDSYITKSHEYHLNAESLMRQFLNYGDVPCISGIEGVEKFDPYLYLSEKCTELTFR